MLASFDTELTGLDLWHGCLPFSMQICSEDGTVHFWEWDVDPFTRIPDIDFTELLDVLDRLNDFDELIFSNPKIDLRAFDRAWEHVFKEPSPVDWCRSFKIHDTVVKSHCLYNLWPHGLKDLRSIFLRVSTAKQDALKKATDAARRICRSKAFMEKYGKWKIADVGNPHWPGIIKAPQEKEEDVEGWWMFDTWLPKAIWTQANDFLPDKPSYDRTTIIGRFGWQDWFEQHPWRTALKDYAIEDVETAIPVNDVMDDGLQIEGLTDIASKRHELIEITYSMESEGVSIFPSRIKSEIHRYREEEAKSNQMLTEVATSIGLEEFNPDSHVQLKKLLYEVWGLPVLARTEPSDKFPEGQPKTDAATLEKLSELMKDSPPCHIQNPQLIRTFFSHTLNAARNGKACEYLESYLAWSTSHGPGQGYRIHNSINVTGTRFCRQSNNNPNLQNVGTGKDMFTDEGEKYTDFLLREVFGPRPGEEWLSIDFQSIEYLIWGFSCGSQAVIDTYNAGLPLFKPIMEAIWGFWNKEDKKYKKCKNGIYSRIYGAAEGHADKTFGKEGAVKLIEAGMPEIRPFTRRLHQQVKKHGYITTLAGYRLYVEETEPHKAVSAFVQGHAGWVIGRAMKRCYEYLRSFPEIRIILQIHDELIFKGPAGFHQQHVKPLAGFMRESGEEFNIPTPVNAALITADSNWGNPVSIAI